MKHLFVSAALWILSALTALACSGPGGFQLWPVFYAEAVVVADVESVELINTLNGNAVPPHFRIGIIINKTLLGDVSDRLDSNPILFVTLRGAHSQMAAQINTEIAKAAETRQRPEYLFALSENGRDGEYRGDFLPSEQTPDFENLAILEPLCSIPLILREESPYSRMLQSVLESDGDRDQELIILRDFINDYGPFSALRSRINELEQQVIELEMQLEIQNQ